MKIIETVDSDEEYIIFYTVKNAISHCYIKTESLDDEITHIVFKERFSRNNQYHTILKFSVVQLMEYALFVAEKHLERYKIKKE